MHVVTCTYGPWCFSVTRSDMHKLRATFAHAFLVWLHNPVSFLKATVNTALQINFLLSHLMYHWMHSDIRKITLELLMTCPDRAWSAIPGQTSCISRRSMSSSSHMFVVKLLTASFSAPRFYKSHHVDYTDSRSKERNLASSN